jgi:acyl-CoA thioester hydrolase
MPAEFKMPRRVTFAETDMAGVMHFSNYFRWMEEIEHAFFRSAGMSVVQEHGEETISWPRVHVSCEYFAPARFEDEIDMRLEIVSLGEKSLTYEVIFTKNGQRLARGRTKAVCCRMSAGGVFESTAIPPTIREKLEQSK